MVIGTREELLVKIGSGIKRQRLSANISQKELARRSGVSLKAIANLETGSGATLGTFILVSRSLGLDGWIERFAEEKKEEFSPIAYVEALKKMRSGVAKTRQRASKGG